MSPSSSNDNNNSSSNQTNGHVQNQQCENSTKHPPLQTKHHKLMLNSNSVSTLPTIVVSTTHEYREVLRALVTQDDFFVEVGSAHGKTTEHVGKRCKAAVGFDMEPILVEDCRRKYNGFEMKVNAVHNDATNSNTTNENALHDDISPHLFFATSTDKQFCNVKTAFHTLKVSTKTNKKLKFELTDGSKKTILLALLGHENLSKNPYHSHYLNNNCLEKNKSDAIQTGGKREILQKKRTIADQMYRKYFLKDNCCNDDDNNNKGDNNIDSSKPKQHPTFPFLSNERDVDVLAIDIAGTINLPMLLPILEALKLFLHPRVTVVKSIELKKLDLALGNGREYFKSAGVES